MIITIVMVQKLLADESINSIATLDKLFKEERNYKKRDRLLCIIWSIDEKLSAATIAYRLRRHKYTVRSWIKSYNEHGLEGLNPSATGGSKSILSQEDEDYIISLLDKDPKKFGFLTNIWDTKLLAAAFGEKKGIKLHKDVVWRMLRRRGYSYKKPEVQNPRANEKLKKKQSSKSNPWKKR